MSTVEKIIHEIQALDPIDQESILVALAGRVRSSSNLTGLTLEGYSSVVSTPGVCGGAARLIRTRIPVWVLENMRRVGISEIDILQSYPILQAGDLAQAWAYVARNREEIERAIHENEES
jgi:uncharacterized protein (DUF433 family)